jgi:hypothetical protein
LIAPRRTVRRSTPIERSVVVGCLLAILALITPRFVLVIMWLFTDYLARAYDSFIWPTLGFFLLPATTIMYAIAENEFDGVRGWGLVLVILGVLVDIGVLGGGAQSRRNR